MRSIIRFTAASLTITIGIILHANTILATSWVYPFVVWEGYTYEVLDEKIKDVDGEVGSVTRYSDMETYSGNFSNAYKKGTKYYAIQGINTEEAIAVEVEDGIYKKAERRGPFEAEKQDPYIFVEKIMVTFFVLIIIAVFIAIGLTFKKNKNRG
ncbi:hypothetical protein [Gracilibacillus kekensis]|uniref:Uncharacterized protein n=1 Tax=Gracilibacillus kekensis TaxID=1027249 RepID=A0A1M7IXM0_9BACI|nr:hypothetical protein [Gracilibacillus kekensis]SHM45425.1 hypothetical protein SAMN05216179_0185 [Gracilibacillus kekensis]